MSKWDDLEDRMMDEAIGLASTTLEKRALLTPSREMIDQLRADERRIADEYVKQREKEGRPVELKEEIESHLERNKEFRARLGMVVRLREERAEGYHQPPAWLKREEHHLWDKLEKDIDHKHLELAHRQLPKLASYLRNDAQEIRERGGWNSTVERGEELGGKALATAMRYERAAKTAEQLEAIRQRDTRERPSQSQEQAKEPGALARMVARILNREGQGENRRPEQPAKSTPPARFRERGDRTLER